MTNHEYNLKDKEITRLVEKLKRLGNEIAKTRKILYAELRVFARIWAQDRREIK